MTNQSKLEKAIAIIEELEQGTRLNQEEQDRLSSAKSDLMRIWKGR